MSQAGYCFVNLRSALEFIKSVDGTQLTISESDYQDAMRVAEVKLREEDIVEASKEGLFSNEV
jgi:hypothetical protein